MLLLFETMNFIYIYTQNLIGNITFSIDIIPVAVVNRGTKVTKHSKRYENVASHSLKRIA